MVAAGGYIINDYYDAKIDFVNRPHKVIVGKYLSRRKALILHVILSIMAIAIGYVVSWKIAMLHVVSVSFLWYYSNHLRRFFIGKIVISLLTGLCILSVGLTFEIVSLKLMAYAAFGGTIVWVRELIKDMENAEGENMFGVESVPKVWGFTTTKRFIAIIGVAGLSLLVYFMIRVDSKPFYILYASMIPLFVLFIVWLIRADRKAHFRRLRHLINLLILVGLSSMLII